MSSRYGLTDQQYTCWQEKQEGIRGGSGQWHALPRRPQVTEAGLEAARLRILGEIRGLDEDPLDGCEVLRKSTPAGEEDIFNWRVIIPGREGTPYEGGTIIVDIRMTPDYPAYPPQVQVVTPIFHYNVEERGTFYQWSIIEDWQPTTTMAQVLRSLVSMLFSTDMPDPEVHSQSKAALLREEPRQYEKYVREWTAKYGKWDQITNYRGTVVLDAGVSPVGADQASRRIVGQHIPNALEKKET